MIASPRAACPMDCEPGDLNPYEVHGKAFKIKAHKSDFLCPNTPECPPSWSPVLIKVRVGIILHSPAISVILKHWQSVLRKAGVRYRNFYQRRHTYASLLLSAGENPMWMASQTGHADWGMIRKGSGG